MVRADTFEAGPGPPGTLRERLAALAPFDAKLTVPAPRPGIVPRPALVDRLTAGAEPVVVLSAATGYGKSTLLAEWAAVDPRPFAWVSLTEFEDDAFALVAYVARALDSTEPLDAQALAALTRSEADLTTTLLPWLGRALRGRTEPVVLVLDDVHLLRDPACTPVLSTLVDHLGPGSRLVLAGRTDPALLVSRLRAEGRLLRLTDADLGLTGPESGALVRAAGLELDDDALAVLVERADGWPAGLYLATIAVRGGRDLDQSARAFRGDDRVVAELLRDEVLPSLPPETVHFLVCTSILERLTASLCDAVLERGDSADALDELARSNLFLVPLDRGGRWYRYHHLFRDLLHAELERRQPEAEASLHARAAAWFDAAGDVEAAIRHAAAGGDLARAAALLWADAPAHRRWSVGRRPAPARRLPARRRRRRTAPRDVGRVVVDHLARPGRHRVLARRGRTRSGRRVLADGRSVRGLTALLRASLGREGLTAMRRDAALAYRLKSDGSPFRPLADFLSGAACRLLGDDTAAREHLDAALRSAGPFIPPITCQALGQLAMIDLESDWPAAERRIARARAVAREHDLREHPAQVMTYSLSSYTLARRGDHVEAGRDALHARGLLGAMGDHVRFLAIEARLVLARGSLLLGDVATARLLLQEAESVLERFPDPGILPDRLRLARKGVDDVHLPVGVIAAPLTTAELRVLRYLPTHLTLAAIAEELYVSRNTAKTHAISVYRKLGVSSRQAAVEQARTLGLLDDDG